MLNWSIYTIFVTPEASIMVANFPGVLINAINLLVIAYYSPSRARAIKIIVLGVLVLAASCGVFLGLFLTQSRTYAAASAGAIMATCNALFFVSAWPATWRAVRSLDISALPTTLAYVQFIQASNWIGLGVIYPDLFIVGVNAAGAASALLMIVGIQYVSCRLRVLARRARRDGAGAPKAVSGGGDNATPAADAATSTSSSGSDVEVTAATAVESPASDDTPTPSPAAVGARRVAAPSTRSLLRNDSTAPSLAATDEAAAVVAVGEDAPVTPR
jgi:hypothetical protein